MSVRVRALTAAVAAAVACALALDGCSNGRPTAPAPTASACPTSAPGMTGRSASVGLLYSNTGGSAQAFTPFRAGVDARFGVANAAGGVGGRKISYTWADDRSEPAGNASAARALVTDDHDFAVLEDSGYAAGSAAYLSGAGVPVLGTPYDLSWTTSRNMFSHATYFAQSSPVSTVGMFARSRGGRRAVLLASSTSLAGRVADGTTALSLAEAGVKVVGTLDASAAKPDVAALARTIKSLRADVLTSPGSPDVLARTALAAKRAGAKLTSVITPFGYDQDVLARYGRALPELVAYLTVAPFEENLPAHRAYLAAMAAYAPQVQPAQSPIALDGWVTADMFLRGLAAAGPCPTRAGYLAALRAVNDYDAGGLLPRPVDFAADFGQISTCYIFVRPARSGRTWQVQAPAPTCGTRLTGALPSAG